MLQVIDSFRSTGLNGAAGSHFVGLDNYREAFKDDLVWNSLWHSVQFTLYVVPCIVVVALLMALIAHHTVHFKWLWRLCFFAPFLLPSAVIGNLWWWMFQPTNGMVNHVLGLTTPWLGQKSIAMLAVVDGHPVVDARASTSCSTWPGCRGSRQRSTRPRR